MMNESELEDFEAELKRHPKWVINGIDTLHEGEFDFIILDTPPGPTVYLQQALMAAWILEYPKEAAAHGIKGGHHGAE